MDVHNPRISYDPYETFQAEDGGMPLTALSFKDKRVCIGRACNPDSIVISEYEVSRLCLYLQAVLNGLVD